MDFIFWFSLAIFVVSTSFVLEIVLGAKRIRRLKDLPLASLEHTPRVSIVVAALNEADTIEPAIRSLLALHYPDLEIIAVNDRSTDETPAILDRVASENARLRVLHVSALPAGWLGKNHALHQGAQLASGDYLLFTDADVVFESSTLKRAVAYCERNHVDHLALLFDIIVNTQLLRMLILSFSASFLFRFKPWKVETSPSHFLGVGAFNMVRSEAYRRAGGHAAIPLTVLDDMMLGKLMKKNGFRQHALDGAGLVSVEWYRNTPEMYKGLQKNIFSAFDYQLVQLVAFTALVIAVRIWPWIGLFVAEGPSRWINAATIVVGLAFYYGMVRVIGWSPRCLVFAPIISVIELVMWWHGCLLTLLRGGIEWRGTRYALTELRKGMYR